ncbi:MAG: hypothetical protein E7016_03865 [Alphaproteobacteria bacterium]|nr:hypothetical protein [Alphaproteobacteria bacterium]
MRKYFLWSAVALMLTTTANATTDYAEVTAKATIEVAGTFSCSVMNFGTIVVKQNNAISTVTFNDDTENGINQTTGDILSLTDAQAAFCEDIPLPEVSMPTNVLLTSNTSTDKLSISNFAFDTNYEQYILGTLTIPANVKAGEYTGSFTITYTY